MHHQRRIRIAAVQALFQLEAQGPDFAGELAGFLESQELAPADIVRTRQLLDRATEKRAEIDEWIKGTAQHWDLQRITPIDRSILRLAICEMLFVERTPPKVAINEAIELAKDFGEADSPRFINGLLDAIWRKSKSQD